MPEGSALSVTYGGSPLFDNKQQANGGTAQVSQGPVQVTLTLRAPDGNSLIVATLGIALGVVVILLCTLLVNRLLTRALRQDAAELIRYSDELTRQPGVTARDHFHFPLFTSGHDPPPPLPHSSSHHSTNMHLNRGVPHTSPPHLYLLLHSPLTHTHLHSRQKKAGNPVRSDAGDSRPHHLESCVRLHTLCDTALPYTHLRAHETL